MKNKHIIRTIIQTLLTTITTFTIFMFYQYDTPSFLIKKIVTIALIVANCVYNHWYGLRSGIEMNEEYEDRMRELREESFNKIVDMIVEEKMNDRAVE